MAFTHIFPLPQVTETTSLMPAYIIDYSVENLNAQLGFP